MSAVLEVLNPFDLGKIGSVDVNSWHDIDEMLDGASQLHRDRDAWLPAYQRIEVLQKTARIMSDRAEDLASLIASEGGKPLIDARVEVTRAIDGVGLCIHEIGQMAGREIPMDLTAAGSGRIAFTQREPIGVVVAASAFNHPLNLIVHQVAPAVATGCPVRSSNQLWIRRCPARHSWTSCMRRACRDRGAIWRFATMMWPRRMITDPRVGFFSFIGSARVGWMLRSKLAPGTRCALEHGGAAPVIVDETADLDTMIPLLSKGGFYHSGQVCVSVQRVFAPSTMAEQIAGKLASAASALRVGDARDPETDCGPLIRPAEVDRVAHWVDEAVQGGATLVTGGKKLGPTTYAPTVLLNPPADARVSTAEIFGPVVCVYSYDQMDAAILAANSLPFAFQAAVFTKSLDVAMQAVRRLDATAVMVNDHSAFRVDWMPFADVANPDTTPAASGIPCTT